MQLHSQHLDIESALAEFVSAAFSPGEREIARLRALYQATPPRSSLRAVIEYQMRDVRLRQLRGTA